MRPTGAWPAITTETTDAWKASLKVGSRRPMIRATIEQLHVGTTPYDLSKLGRSISGNTINRLPRQEAGSFASAQFCWSTPPVELPNILSCKWNRSVDADAGTMTMQLLNTEPLPLGETQSDTDDFDRPGHYTPNRGGTTACQTQWGQTSNNWQGVLVPDRVIRVYEGYGYDPDVAPGKDTNLYLTGTWLIDDVEFGSDGTIKVTARDYARMLMDHICFPPVVPWDSYPLSMSWYHWRTIPARRVVTGGWFRATYHYDSSRYYANAGYAGCRGGAYRGHHGRFAFDGSHRTYWMTLNNRITHGHGWVEAKFSARTITAVEIDPWNGPYRAYVSLYSGGRWLGRHRVPYRPRDLYTNMNIPYVNGDVVAKNTITTIRMPKPITGVTHIRLTFTHIGTYGGDGQHVGIRGIRVSNATARTIPARRIPSGDVAEWGDVVKWLLAWGGWFWTRTKNTALNRHYDADGTYSTITPISDDGLFPQGAIWGDIETTGVGGRTDLGIDFFDKQPLMDVISKVRDIVNYIFWIDEFGGAVFRSPNIWQLGNYISGLDGGPHDSRVSDYVTIYDDETLISAAVKLSSRNVRERTVIASANGDYGGVARGIVNTSTGPYENGMRRVGVWTDQNFASAEECQIMADLVAVRAMFEWRTVTLKIPGYPRLQPDDQVRIFERVTAETYLQYIRGISSENDLRSGQWVYTLNTHWLGEEPFSNWVFDPSDLSVETQQYLRAMGKI